MKERLTAFPSAFLLHPCSHTREANARGSVSELSDDSILQNKQELSRLFRRERFYINAAKLVKDSLVGRVEERELRGQRAPPRARSCATQRVAAVLPNLFRRGARARLQIAAGR